MIRLSLQDPSFLQFFWYFIRLRLSVALGQYYTANPLDIRWRWQHWQHYKKFLAEESHQNKRSHA